MKLDVSYSADKAGGPAPFFRVGSIDAFQRQLEDAQIDLDVSPPNFVPVRFVNETDWMSVVGRLLPTILIIGACCGGARTTRLASHVFVGCSCAVLCVWQDVWRRRRWCVQRLQNRQSQPRHTEGHEDQHYVRGRGWLRRGKGVLAVSLTVFQQHMRDMPPPSLRGCRLHRKRSWSLFPS